MIVSTGAAADMFSRMSLAIISFFIEFKARHIYFAGVAGTILFRFGMFWLIQIQKYNVHYWCKCLSLIFKCFSIFAHTRLCWNGYCDSDFGIFKNVVAHTIGSGFRRAFTTREVISMHFCNLKIFRGNEMTFFFRFASGYSLFMLFQGNFAFLIGPFIG